MPRSFGRFGFLAVCLVCVNASTPLVFASDCMLSGPSKVNLSQTVNADEVETSCVKIAFSAAIRFYQKRISPVSGVDRCGFRPSCSAYGCQALSEYGPVAGIMMIGDRLIRCNIWKESGPDYTLLPNGKLYDPPSQNVLP